MSQSGTEIDRDPLGSQVRADPRPLRPLSFAVLITALAGFLDAIGYVQLNHLFVSFMSGNSTHLGITLAEGAWPDALLAIGVIASFVAGAILGTSIADRAGSSLLIHVLRAETVVLVVSILLAVSDHGQTALILIALAMGMQNTLHQVVSGADIGKGFITGTLFALGQSISRAVGDRKEALRIAPNAVCWIAFVGGAVAGARTLSAFGLTCCLVAAAATLLALQAGLRFGRL